MRGTVWTRELCLTVVLFFLSRLMSGAAFLCDACPYPSRWTLRGSGFRCLSCFGGVGGFFAVAGRFGVIHALNRSCGDASSFCPELALSVDDLGQTSSFLLSYRRTDTCVCA